ncbi:MAG: 50S ribosomal protein L30e [Methanosphaera sp.]|jgi:large subunit ribosomal protein L30e|uniref:50S ribosomal protein L30e n=1 Tax=Methanosphaera sp. BMS TaxID=1789762 RepID=UPI000DC1D286|nr:50S ribosomal protein L30e [Methanosphaera sp. BMS]AWX33156.1 50S ribosomal protein L30 [Methanosphaera sp. BMS]MBQ6444021.1 50S ribosomal protein L30e [Methanosphaera sp.]
MDIERGIRVAVDTGKVILGSNKTIQAIKLGNGELVVIANNAPKTLKDDVEAYSKLSNIPVYTFEGSSVELGSICGKPFTVTTLMIQEPGDSNILEIKE